MEVTKPIALSHISEVKILQNVRLINRHDLNPVYSKENLRVQFTLSGELQGLINCYMCIDNLELSASEKNVLFPLFVESMNILIGKQISQDEEFKNFTIKLSSPKFSMVSVEINTAIKLGMQKYTLELEERNFTVLIDYSLEAMNWGIMKTLFSIFGLLVVFVFLLSIEVGNKPLFNHIYGFISPVTKSVQDATQDTLNKSMDQTQAYTKKLFNNSVPKFKDTVKSKLSSNKKLGAEPAETITHKEKKELDQLIKNH